MSRISSGILNLLPMPKRGCHGCSVTTTRRAGAGQECSVRDAPDQTNQGRRTFRGLHASNGGLLRASPSFPCPARKGDRRSSNGPQGVGARIKRNPARLPSASWSFFHRGRGACVNEWGFSECQCGLVVVGCKHGRFMKLVMPSVVSIEFDGGTSCNIPAKGFGVGYGSYRLHGEGGAIVRVEHGPKHSCNSAEILTLCRALEDAVFTAQMLGMPLRKLQFIVRGDSQIALRWVHCKHPPNNKTTPMFRHAISRLRKVVSKVGPIKTKWWPRTNSVRIFGH